MAQRFDELSEKHIQFINKQKIFFVGTATVDSRVNISPKGLDSLRVLNKSRIAWLNLTGSGNETAAHLQIQSRMTLMFCSFEGEPLVLYGAARVIHRHDPQWSELISLFPPLPGARQIFDLSIDLVQTSCGFGVPLYTYAGQRQLLLDWATKKGEEGVQRYWRERNQSSLDGIPTNIINKDV